VVAASGVALGILSKAKSDPTRQMGAHQETDTHMTLSENPREAITMTGSVPSGGTLVSVTEAAAKKVIELRSREGKADARLRLFVKSGGCSGFSYGLAFDDKVNEGDRVEEHAGVPVVIDQFSQQHVDGAEIDYVDSLMGSGFAINNPNAVSSCACGSSFNTDGSPAKAGGCAH
jgi:iron-sulfur cluster assembly protein